MLATACQRGHVEVVKLLVHTYNADTEDCAVHSGEFAIISGLPLYAAAQAGTVGFCSSHTSHYYCREGLLNYKAILHDIWEGLNMYSHQEQILAEGMNTYESIPSGLIHTYFISINFI